MPARRHIYREIDVDLSHIDRLVAMVWDLVERQWQTATRAVDTREPVLAADTASREESINDLGREIERSTTRFLALRQPMADDLRFIIAGLRISIDLERIGDYASNIARRAALIGKGSDAVPAESVPAMAGMVQHMIRDLHQDYMSRNLSLSPGVIKRDEELNALYEQVFTDLRTRMTQDPTLVEICTELLFIARNIERSGDHAKNIARHLHYLFSGVQYQGANEDTTG